MRMGRPIYTAASADAAVTALEAFEQCPWGIRFPTVVAAWRMPVFRKLLSSQSVSTIS